MDDERKDRLARVVFDDHLEQAQKLLNELVHERRQHGHPENVRAERDALTRENSRLREIIRRLVTPRRDCAAWLSFPHGESCTCGHTKAHTQARKEVLCANCGGTGGLSNIVCECCRGRGYLDA